MGLVVMKTKMVMAARRGEELRKLRDQTVVVVDL
jgi:hypothetical protein